MLKFGNESEIFFQPELIRKRHEWSRKKYPVSVNIASYPYMYLTEDVYKDLFSSAPSIDTLAVYVHEFKHLLRQKSFPYHVGIWWTLYETLDSFRLREELIAAQAEMDFYADRRTEYPLTEKARLLASNIYNEMIGFVDAKIRLSFMWRETLRRTTPRE